MNVKGSKKIKKPYLKTRTQSKLFNFWVEEHFECLLLLLMFFFQKSLGKKRKKTWKKPQKNGFFSDPLKLYLPSTWVKHPIADITRRNAGVFKVSKFAIVLQKEMRKLFFPKWLKKRIHIWLRRAVTLRENSIFKSISLYSELRTSFI